VTKFYSQSVGGFVDPSILGDAMPGDAVGLTDDQYNALMNGQLGGGIAHDMLGVPSVVDPLSSLSLDELKLRKLAELSAAFATRIATLKAAYPEDEIQSWFKQEAEAKAYVADNTAATPLLAAMARARGISIDDLAGRVIANADVYSVAAGSLIGNRQKYEDEVNAAANTTAVAAITWQD
jgi:hypothetical protein